MIPVTFNSLWFNTSPFNGQFSPQSLPPPTATQFIPLPEFLQSISDYLITTGVVGPSSVFWSIDPDSVTQWPVSPPPFLLIVPRRMKISGDDIGGGRFSVLWDVTLEIHVVVLNSYDPSYTDTVIVTSQDQQTGPHYIAGILIDKLEQAYITTPSGDYSTVEFPRSTKIDELHRFKQSNFYASIPVTFVMVVAEEMPSTIIASATAN